MNAQKAAWGGASIRIRIVGQDQPMHFEVAVRDSKGEMQYHVTLLPADYERLSGGNATPEECVRAAFLFLLDREPKESILRRFDVSVIARYFPEFSREFPCYLNGQATLQGKS